VTEGFGLENLPYGAVARPGGPAQLAVRVGDEAMLLAPLEERVDLPPGTLAGPTLNPLLALGRPAWTALRETVSDAVNGGAPTVPLGELEPRLPVAVGDYVDFYSSLEHATNLGGRTPNRCCPTGATCRSATTAGPARS
jgi:fumarylacetoacetase